MNDMNNIDLTSNIENICNEKFDLKNYIIRYNMLYFLDKCFDIFEYENLPENLTQRIFEKMLLCNGYGYFIQYQDKFHFLWGSLGGELNENYVPKKIIITNPHLPLNETYNIDTDGVLVNNDTMRIGLLPMINKYALLYSENDVTMKMLSIQMRNIIILTAQDETSKQEAEIYINKIINGKLSIIGDTPIFDNGSVNLKNANGVDISNSLKTCIEYSQYLKASFLNEIGVNANYNMKRESIMADEAQLNNDGLIPFIQDMYNNRLDGVKRINEKFGLNIKVKMRDVWENNIFPVNGKNEEVKTNDND